MPHIISRHNSGLLNIRKITLQNRMIFCYHERDMKCFLPALLTLSSALLPAMGEQAAPPSTEKPTIVFSRPKLATPLSKEQQDQAGLLLCRIHDRASSDAAAAQFATLLGSAVGELSHWTQFGNARHWEKVLPSIIAADYYGSESLRNLFTPLITQNSEEEGAAAPYVLLIQDFASSCERLAVSLENVTDAATARRAHEAVQAFTATFPDWKQRVHALPTPKGNIPMFLNATILQAQQQVAHILRAWAQLELRSSDAYGEGTLLTNALPELAASLQNDVGTNIPRLDKISKLYSESETALPLLHSTMEALSAVTDKESADAAAIVLENNFRNMPRSIDRWLETFYPESKPMLRQIFTLYRSLEQMNPPFYGSEELQHALDYR